MRNDWINTLQTINESRQAGLQAGLQADSQPELARRNFLKAGGVLGAGLVLGFFVPGGQKVARAADAAKAITPNAFLRIAPDNTVTVLINRLEFGQGVTTGMPMLIAEELGADFAQMRSELAPADLIFKDPVFGIQMTGGSSSIKNSYRQYREIGAAARTMLIAAAAQKWQVTLAECHTANGRVVGPLGYSAGFGELAEAAMQLPVPETVTLKKPEQFTLIGKPTPRTDALAKSTGSQQFGIDFTLPNIKVALLARAPVFGSTVASFDAAKTLAVPGVIAAFKVATDRGGSGVAVVADGYWSAKKGRDALQVKWNTANVEKADSVTQLAAFKALAKTPGSVATKADMSAMAQAVKKIEAEYEFPYLAHAPMEPLNCVIDYSGSAARVWVGSQFQTIDQGAVARALGLKQEQVTLTTMTAGGGFGRRGVPTSDYLVEASHIAKAYRELGKTEPVKVMWSREDDIRGGYYRPSHVHRAVLGFDQHGKLLAWDHTVVGQSIMSGTAFEKMMIKDGVDNTMVEGLTGSYNLPMKISVHNARANVPVLWYRSVGGTHNGFVMETLIDEAAHMAGTDPVAYRKQLLGGEHPRHVAALDLAVSISGYGKTKLPKGHAFGVAVHESFDSVVAYVVEASVVKGTPKLLRVWAGVHCNQAVNPLSVEAQVQGALLMALGTTLPGSAITLRDGVVQQQNFNDYTVARMPDMPVVTVAIVPSSDAPTGMGEPGFPPLAPAYANALAKITGKRLRSLPFNLA